MLTLEQISNQFPLSVRQINPRGILVEYLQYEVLDSLFKDAAAGALSFMGGTAIRILHNSPRFSEDLDFDNFRLSFEAFEKLLKAACRDMEYKGFVIEYRVVEKGSYHCYIRFPEILQRTGLSPITGEKILIRIDSEVKARIYEPDNVFLNRFGVYRRIPAAPVKILLAQKLLAILYRKRQMGRDIYDASFLMSLAPVDFDYIQKMVGLDETQFMKTFEHKLQKMDLDMLALDVTPFLFTPQQAERVTTFRDYWYHKVRTEDRRQRTEDGGLRAED